MKIRSLIAAPLLLALGFASSSAMATNPDTDDSVIFLKIDAQPLKKTQVVISKSTEEAGTYDCVLTTVTENVVHFFDEDKTTLIANATCVFSETETNCKIDQRAVDGAMRELSIRKNAKGTYDATLFYSVDSMMNGKGYHVRNEIAYGLSKY